MGFQESQKKFALKKNDFPQLFNIDTKLIGSIHRNTIRDYFTHLHTYTYTELESDGKNQMELCKGDIFYVLFISSLSLINSFVTKYRCLTGSNLRHFILLLSNVENDALL